MFEHKPEACFHWLPRWRERIQLAIKGLGESYCINPGYVCHCLYKVLIRTRLSQPHRVTVWSHSSFIIDLRHRARCWHKFSFCSAGHSKSSTTVELRPSNWRTQLQDPVSTRSHSAGVSLSKQPAPPAPFVLLLTPHSPGWEGGKKKKMKRAFCIYFQSTVTNELSLKITLPEAQPLHTAGVEWDGARLRLVCI